MNEISRGMEIKKINYILQYLNESIGAFHLAETLEALMQFSYLGSLCHILF